MNFRLSCILSLFIFNIIIHSFLENSHIQISDFRYTKTTCMPGYNYWSNNINNIRYLDIKASPYSETRICWVSRDDISFRQPYLPYKMFFIITYNFL